MHEVLEYLIRAAIVGIGATAFMDVTAVARKWLLRSASLDYGLVGRWLAYVARGRFHHDRIDAALPIRGERLIGWTAHYMIGVAFAALLLAIWGLDWACRPTLVPALIVGIGSVVAPFLIMQPGMGAGIAASRTPHPPTARVRSLVTHTTFGIGLYVAGLLASLLGAFDCAP